MFSDMNLQEHLIVCVAGMLYMSTSINLWQNLAKNVCFLILQQNAGLGFYYPKNTFSSAKTHSLISEPESGGKYEGKRRWKLQKKFF